MPLSSKYRFLLSNLAKGLLWLAAIVILFLLFREHGNIAAFKEWLQPFYDEPIWMYLIYALSEVFFGIIPPELFMIWALHWQNPWIYLEVIILLAVISYGAGFIGFLFGHFLGKSFLYKSAKQNFFSRYQKSLHRYGFFLLIVAAVTPIPFSGICMLVGASHYPLRKFLLYTLFRLLRFGVYGFIIWQSQGMGL
jgi:membrane protein DedA with SNARE-associated domain